MQIGMPLKFFYILRGHRSECAKLLVGEKSTTYFAYTGSANIDGTSATHGFISFNREALIQMSEGCSVIRIYATKQEDPVVSFDMMDSFVCTVPWCTEIPRSWLFSPEDNLAHILSDRYHDLRLKRGHALR